MKTIKQQQSINQLKLNKMIVQYNELYNLSFFPQKNTPLFNELKYTLWSIYEGLEQMGDIEETDKDYFIINNEEDMQKCVDFLEEKYNLY